MTVHASFLQNGQDGFLKNSAVCYSDGLGGKLGGKELPEEKKK